MIFWALCLAFIAQLWPFLIWVKLPTYQALETETLVGVILDQYQNVQVPLNSWLLWCLTSNPCEHPAPGFLWSLVLFPDLSGSVLTFLNWGKTFNLQTFCPSYSCEHRWFSGRMLACHAGGPGSIPGRCKPFSANFTKNFKHFGWFN